MISGSPVSRLPVRPIAIKAGGGTTAASTPVQPPTSSQASSQMQVTATLQVFFNGVLTFFKGLFDSILSMVHAGPSATPASAVAPNVSASPPAAAPTQPPVGTFSMRDVVSRTQDGQGLQLGAGTYTFDNFGSDLQGVDIPEGAPGFAGAGVDKTVIQMAPRTSTHAGDVPTQQYASNEMNLIRVAKGSPNVHDFTVKGTDQGHLYSGLHIEYTTNAQISNVKVTGIPGGDAAPPGETTGLDEYRSTGSVYKNIEIDGAGVGASCFATNVSSNVTVDHGYFHDSAFAHGAAFWETRDINVIDTTATHNKLVGLNFEQTSGTVNIVRPVLNNNGECDIGIASNKGSATFNIYDPVLAPGQKLRIGTGGDYMGKPNLQKVTDIHVFVNGVDRTNEVVQWV